MSELARPHAASRLSTHRITLRLFARPTMSFTISATAARVVATPAFATKVSKVRTR
jgi:hypothetical protein